jgi:hypothetical protein
MRQRLKWKSKTEANFHTLTTQNRENNNNLELINSNFNSNKLPRRHSSCTSYDSNLRPIVYVDACENEDNHFSNTDESLFIENDEYCTTPRLCSIGRSQSAEPPRPIELTVMSKRPNFLQIPNENNENQTLPILKSPSLMQRCATAAGRLFDIARVHSPINNQKKMKSFDDSCLLDDRRPKKVSGGRWRSISQRRKKSRPMTMDGHSVEIRCLGCCTHTHTHND